MLVLSVQPIATPSGGGLLGSFSGFSGARWVRSSHLRGQWLRSAPVRRRRPSSIHCHSGKAGVRFADFTLLRPSVCGHFGRWVRFADSNFGIESGDFTRSACLNVCLTLCSRDGKSIERLRVWLLSRWQASRIAADLLSFSIGGSSRLSHTTSLCRVKSTRRFRAIGTGRHGDRPDRTGPGPAVVGGSVRRPVGSDRVRTGRGTEPPPTKVPAPARCRSRLPPATRLDGSGQAMRSDTGSDPLSESSFSPAESAVVAVCSTTRPPLGAEESSEKPQTDRFYACVWDNRCVLFIIQMPRCRTSSRRDGPGRDRPWSKGTLSLAG